MRNATFALLLLAATTLAGSVDVLLTTRDGETVEGRLSLSSLKLQTAFGSATVQMEKLAEIRFGDPDVVTAVGGTQLEGKLSLGSVRLETAAGRRTFKRGEIATLATMEHGRPRGAADFGGEWSGTWGPMKLAQRGVEVTGTYGFEDEFSIEGRVKGNRLEFRYKEPRASGEGWFELFADGSAFKGEFQADGANDTRFWGAYRIAAAMPAPQPGQIVSGQAKSWLNFHLRVPKGFDGRKRFPAIAFFHGSNMSSRAYVETIAATWPELAADYIVVGIDGEKLSPASEPGNLRHNFTYINYSGPDWGGLWIRRQSPALVAEAIRELDAALPVEHWFVGGHSQGGFLTYAMVMYFPELMAGAFPMSCNLLVQCEPDHFKDEEVRAAQRKVALAPIHGENDQVVAFSGGEYCHERMQDGGFPALRLFRTPGGHSFMHLPVDEAVRWLETMCCGNAARLAEFAAEAEAAGNDRDALAAILRAREGANPAAVAELDRKIDRKAAPEAKRLLRLIEAKKDNGWVDDFWAFRARYANAPCAAEVLEAYAALRAEHAEPAAKLFYAARNERDAEARLEKYREILERYYASKWWKLVRRWVEEG